MHYSQTIINRVLCTLNEACAADPVAMAGLLQHRVACNRRLSKHPTIQVQAPGPDCAAGGAGESDPGADFRVDLLGLLNGLLEPLTGLGVAAVYESGSAEGETRLAGFKQQAAPGAVTMDEAPIREELGEALGQSGAGGAAGVPAALSTGAWIKGRIIRLLNAI